MQDKQRIIEILEALANGVDPVSGEVFPSDSPYQNAEVVRALFNAVNELKASEVRGNKGSKWSEAEDQQLKDNFSKGFKTAELAKLHGRSSGAIRSRLIKLGLVEEE
jgi:hypothetical protein